MDHIFDEEHCYDTHTYEGGGEPLAGEEEEGNRFVLDILTYFFFFHVP